VAIIEGTGIVAAGKEARAKALAKSKQVTSDKKIAAEYKVDPIDRMIRDIDRASKRLGSQESTGAVKETGRGMGDRFNPFTDKVDASDQIKKRNFFSPGGGIFDKRNNVNVATADLSGLVSDSDEKSESTFGTSFTEQASANLADASVYQKKEEGIYRPSDNIYDSLEKITRPKIIEKKQYVDIDGNIFDKSPYKSLFSDDDTPNDAKFLGRVGDDLKLSQPYNKRLGQDAFRKEQAGYLRSQGVDENTITRLSGDVPRTMSEKTGNFFKSLFPGFRDTSQALTKYDVKEMSPREKEFYDNEYKDYRKDMRDKVFSESPYGEDVEKKYYYKDFQQPGVYRSEKEVQSYIKDRGAFMTGMPSNFQGGVSGIGKTTDDFSKDPRYQSTAGNLEKEKEPSTLQKVGNFIGTITRPPSAAAGELTGVDKALSGATKKLHLGSSGHTVDGVYMPSIAEAYKRPKTNIEKGLDKAGTFVNKMLGISGAEGAENPLSRTVPSGSFNISQEGKDQAAINKGIKAAEATGIPTGVAAQGGVTTQKAIDAGIQARQEAADTRAKNMSEAQGIADRNPNVSIVGGKAVATNNSGKARAQAMAVNRKIQGKTISQVKAENKKSMQEKAKLRSEAFKRNREQKKQQKAQGFSKPSTPAQKTAVKKSTTVKKSSPSTTKSSPSSTSTSKSQGKGGKRGGSKGGSGGSGSSSKGGSSKGGSKGGTGKGGAKGGAKGGSGSKGASSKGGSFGGKRRRSNTKRSRRRCDIFLKYNISPLTDMNLIRDDLAEVAYFVKEIQK